MSYRAFSHGSNLFLDTTFALTAVPASYSYGRFFYLNATKILTKDMRKKGWVALYVSGDGNCIWRLLAKFLWDYDEHWIHVKLVVLRWAAANAKYLVGEGRILHKCSKYYPYAIHKEYSSV